MTQLSAWGGVGLQDGLSMRITWSMIVVILACLLGQTKEALAWGPATHVGLAASILEHLELLPGAVAAVLARRKIAYFYGNIAADVVFAKRWSRIKQFCHHWSTAFSLLDAARNDRAQAFAYGYLSHLAADTVAHGKYVPRQIAVSQWPVNFGHFYWELRGCAPPRHRANRDLVHNRAATCPVWI